MLRRFGDQVIAIAGAQLHLLNLARARVRQFVHHYHIVRQPPVRRPCRDRSRAHSPCRSRAPASAPRSAAAAPSHFGCVAATIAASATSGCDTAMFSSCDRTDPLAAGLDHVLRAVGDLHVAVGIDGGDVAGGKPAVRSSASPGVPPIVGAAHPRPAHLQVAGMLAVPRQYLALVIDDAHVDAEQRPRPCFSRSRIALGRGKIHVRAGFGML